jgi:cell division protein ZapA
MCKIRDAGKVRARDRIAVLAALNLAFDLVDQHVAPQTSRSGGKVPTEDNREGLSSLLARLDEALTRDDQLI